MTPQSFLETVVHPNIGDFQSHFTDVRHAYNAICAVDAFAAHLFVWAKENAPSARDLSVGDDSAYRDKLACRSEDFALLRDIAKAQKHVKLTRGKPRVTNANQITLEVVAFGEGKYGCGRYGGVEQIVVEVEDGKIFFVENILNNALSFLLSEMSNFQKSSV